MHTPERILLGGHAIPVRRHTKMHCVANGVTVQEFVYAKLNKAVHGCDCGACTECTMAGYRKMRDK